VLNAKQKKSATTLTTPFFILVPIELNFFMAACLLAVEENETEISTLKNI